MKKEKEINEELSEKWEIYFDAKEELEMVYKELLSESLVVIANDEQIRGVTVNKGGKRFNQKAAEEIFKTKGWDIPMKDSTDSNKMKLILAENDISEPITHGNPSAFKKKSKKKKND